MNLQQLRYFREAFEQRSFSAAAKVLHLAQPSLSEQIRRLEGELGVPLFVRVGRGVEPTEAGRALLPHAERVLAEVESARESVAGVRDVRAGTASFGTFSTAVYYLLADLAEAFTARYPACGYASSASTPLQSPTTCGPGDWRPASSSCPSTPRVSWSGPRCVTRCSTQRPPAPRAPARDHVRACSQAARSSPTRATRPRIRPACRSPRALRRRA